MLKDILEKLNEQSEDLTVKFVKDLLDFKVDPKDYEKRRKEVEKQNKKWYNWLPSQGGAGYINVVNYTNLYKKKVK